MKQFNQILLIMMMGIIIITIPNCRGEIIPSDDDLKSYGWVMYEEGDFSEALSWFTQAYKKDSLQLDAYNGIGWSMGHLRQPDSSVYYFKKYASFSDTSKDVYAGLAFAFNALGENDSCRNYANIFIGKQNLILNPGWVFSHNTKFDYLDVFLIKAVSEFRLALFSATQETINDIYSFRGSSTVVDVDYSTVQGRAELSSHLVSLQALLAN